MKKELMLSMVFAVAGPGAPGRQHASIKVDVTPLPPITPPTSTTPQPSSEAT